jgi:hypothetical protein
MAHKDFIDSDISKTIRECFGRTWCHIWKQRVFQTIVFSVMY